MAGWPRCGGRRPRWQNKTGRVAAIANAGAGRLARGVLSKADIARLRSLRDKPAREAAGLFVVEGEKVVAELLGTSNCPLEEIFSTHEWIKENSKAADYLSAIEVTPAEMGRISHYPTPSTVLAVGRIARVPIAPGALDRGLTLALDGVQDAGNVGTLLRVADWFALDRVLLSPDCADLFSQKVINASMGSFARVRVHTAPLADALAGCPTPVLGCDLTGESVHTLPPLRDAVLVIGSEGRGLSPAVTARITRRVTIPRHGGAESLNAAVAAAIVCDNLRRVLAAGN
jgi:TrmH family RNA methyltransferase